MNNNQALLNMLVCPETKQRLSLADERMINDLNTRIADKSLVNRKGETLKNRIDGGLLRDDGKVLYPIIDRIPVLLIDERIEF